jgi:hypothetical protein
MYIEHEQDAQPNRGPCEIRGPTVRHRGFARLRRHAKGCLEARYARLAATASLHKCKRPKIRFLRKVRMHRTGNSMSTDWGTSDDNVSHTAYRGRSEDHDKHVEHLWSDGLSVPRRLSRSKFQPN